MRAFPRPLIRDAFPVALVALLVFQACRLWCLDRYLVPSSSMQPTLYGDRQAGDVVLVEKLSVLWRSSPVLHELVVLRDPDDRTRHLVKRVAGTEGQWVLLEEGDLWLGTDRQRLQRVVKQPLADADLRIPWLRWPGPPGTDDPLHELAGPYRVEEGALVLPPVVETADGWRELLGEEARAERHETMPPRYRLPGLLATRRAVDATFVDLEGRRGGREGAGRGVRDVGMVLEAVPRRGLTGLLLVVQHHPDEVAWSYRADGTVELLRAGRTTGWTANAPELVEGVSVRIEYGFLDQHDFFAVDGRMVGHRERPPPGEDPGAVPGWPDAPRNLLMIGAAGGSVALHGLQVFRDVYYFRERRPFGEAAQEIGSGQVYLLGDNSFSSRDSRTRGPFSLDDLVGRPVLVLAPGTRVRWLSR